MNNTHKRNKNLHKKRYGGLTKTAFCRRANKVAQENEVKKWHKIVHKTIKSMVSIGNFTHQNKVKNIRKLCLNCPKFFSCEQWCDQTMKIWRL